VEFKLNGAYAATPFVGFVVDLFDNLLYNGVWAYIVVEIACCLPDLGLLYSCTAGQYNITIWGTADVNNVTIPQIIAIDPAAALITD